MRFARKSHFYGIAAAIVTLATSSLAVADVYTWQGTTSSDMDDPTNWVGSPTLDFISGYNQAVFGPTSGSVTPQLGAGDVNGTSWLGQPMSGEVVTGLLFDVGAPSYTFGDNDVITRTLGLWTDENTAGSANIVNNSSNTQTFNVTVRTRIGTIDAASGDIVFNGQFRPGDGSNHTARYAILQGDHNIYLNGPVLGPTSDNTNAHIFYRGGDTSAANAGKLYLGDIGTGYISRIVVDSQNGGAVVATSNNSFGDGTYVSSGRRHDHWKPNGYARRCR